MCEVLRKLLNSLASPIINVLLSLASTSELEALK